MPTDDYRRAARAGIPDDQVLDALELTHPAVGAPVRIVVDVAERVIEGATWSPGAVEVLWPGQDEDRHPRARVAVDNVGRVLTQWVERTQGVLGGRLRLLRVLASTSEVEEEVTLDVAGAVVDSARVVLDLRYDAALDSAAVQMRFDPVTAPGLW